MITGFRPAHVWLLAKTYVRFSLRTGAGIVFIFLLLAGTLAFAGMVSKLMIMGIESLPEELMNVEEDASMAERFEGADFMFVSMMKFFNKRVAKEWGGSMPDIDTYFTDATPDKHPQTHFLAKQHPALISLIYLMILWFAPVTACLVGFGQTSVDIGNKGLRYLLLRTERPNIYFGRFLGALGYVFVSMLLAMVIICGYFHFVIRAYGGVEIWTWGIQCVFATLLLVMPYLAICAWVSGALRGGFTALVGCLAACFIPLMLIGYLKFYLTRMNVEWPWLSYLNPIGWKDDLLSHDPVTRLIAMAMMFFMTALFLMLGYRHFSRRDL